MLILLVAVLGALVPTLIYVTVVWWLDRYEKEPVWLLFAAFAWGAVPAAILSVLVEFAVDIPISALGGESLAANLFSVSVSAPVVEETFKGIGLLLLVLLFRREFDDLLDGIVYGAMIGFGFAFAEDVGAYFLPILSEQGLQAGLINIVMRSIVFGFNHAFWTGIVGAAVAYASLHRGWARRLAALVGGWTLAVSLHALHNAGATLAEQTYCLSLGFSLLIDWGGVVLLAVIAVLILRKEGHWIEQELAEEVRLGLLSPAEFLLLRSAWQRQVRRWRVRTGGRGGSAAYRTVGRFYQAATELAFRKHHLRLHGPQPGDEIELARLQRELAELRLQVQPWLFPSGTRQRS